MHHKRLRLCALLLAMDIEIYYKQLVYCSTTYVNRTPFSIPEQLVSPRCVFKFFCFLPSLGDNLTGKAGQSGCIEAITLWTGSISELVQESDGLL